MIPMQEAVDRALAASTADGCVVVGSEHTETNLRWAANNLTTNGQMTSRSVTVISIRDGVARNQRGRGLPLGDLGRRGGRSRRRQRAGGREVRTGRRRRSARRAV